MIDLALALGVFRAERGIGGGGYNGEDSAACKGVAYERQCNREKVELTPHRMLRIGSGYNWRPHGHVMLFVFHQPNS